MQYSNPQKQKELEQLKKIWEQLFDEARQAFLEEILSKEHKEKFNQLTEKLKKALKEWQEYLYKNPDAW